jgi:tol-pal system protein YbgF
MTTMMSRATRVGAITLCLFLGVPAASAQTAAELAVRVDRLEALVRTLTGQVDELTYRLGVLEETIQRLQADYEFRFQRLEGGAMTAPATTAPPAAAPLLGAPPAVLGTVPGDPNALAGAGAPLDLGQVLRGDGNFNLAPPAAVPGGGMPMDAIPLAGMQTAAVSGNAPADYDRFYQLILNGDDVAAEQGFRAFLSAYPGHARTVDAQYWLAESIFSQAAAPGAPTTLYVDAANAYLTAYRSAPQGDKAPDALFKLGMSLVALGQVQDGCTTYGQVLATYPNASNALRERVATEQRNARCG